MAPHSSPALYTQLPAFGSTMQHQLTSRITSNFLAARSCGQDFLLLVEGYAVTCILDTSSSFDLLIFSPYISQNSLIPSEPSCLAYLSLPALFHYYALIVKLLN